MHAVSFYTFVGVCILFVFLMVAMFLYCRKVITESHNAAQRAIVRVEEQFEKRYQYWTGQINTRVEQLSLTEAKRLIDANRSYPVRPDNAGPARIHRGMAGLDPQRQAWRFGGNLHD